MNDHDLTKISLAVTFLGIIALFLVAGNLKPIEASATLINESYVGKNVAVNSTIISVSIKDGNIFITLEEGFKVVLFRDKAEEENYELKRNDKISVIGKVQVYRSELEILAEQVTKIS